MNLSTAIQEALLALLCYDDKAGSIVASLLEPEDYDPVHKKIVLLATEYRQRHQRAPAEHTLDLFDSATHADPERADLYKRLFTSLRTTATSINADYVLDRAKVFARFQNVKKAVGTALRDLQRADEEGLLAAEATLAKAVKPSAISYDPGIDFIRDASRATTFFDKPEESLPTGIPAFDEVGIGPAATRLHLYIAAAKTGKSWWLINLATRAHQAAKRVLYVTLELSEPEVCQRLVQSFFSVSQQHINELQYRRFLAVDDRRDWGLNWDPVTLRKVQYLFEEDARKRIIRKLKTFETGERIIVKSFPIATLTPTKLEAYLDILEQRERFVPDLMIVDYADIMAMPSGRELWQGQIETYQHLKRMAQERRLAVASASQVKISGSKASRVDVNHVGGAWDKIGTADTVLTYSRTKEEENDKLARLLVAAARNAPDRFEVLISQGYSIGQYALSSIRLGENYYAEEDTPS